MTYKKALHVNSGSISYQFERHYFQIKACWRHFCSDFQGVLEGSQRFCLDFRGFCPDFHQMKTFGGAVASPALPPPTPVTLRLLYLLWTNFPAKRQWSTYVAEKHKIRAAIPF